MIREFKIYIEEYHNWVYLEYRLRSFEMYLEGTSDRRVEESVIIEHAENLGLELIDLEISYDKLQFIWRIEADLKKK